MILIGRSSGRFIIIMKKIVIGLLILGLVLATGTTCDCTCSACSGTSTSTSTCTSGDNLCCEPSFDVNSQVCVQQPGTITTPECLLPNIEAPCVPPPTTT